MNCKFCNRICKNDNSLRNHQRLCRDNPDKQSLVSNFIDYNNKRKELGLKGCNQYTKAVQLGLPKPAKSLETKAKHSQSNRGRLMSNEEKLRRSESMKKAVEDHPDSYTKNNIVGRVKNIEYNGVKLKGSWELIVAKWLDLHNIKWEHEVTGFKYQWHDSIRTYYPDFYLPELALYLEVKGYERERDRAKWKVIPNLIIFKLKEINEIKSGILAPLSALAHNELKR